MEQHEGMLKEEGSGYLFKERIMEEKFIHTVDEMTGHELLIKSWKN